MEFFGKVNEVAAAIQVSVQTIYRYVANGEIPFHRLRRAVRFKPSEIERWIENRKAGAAANRNDGGCCDGGLFSETKQGEAETSEKNTCMDKGGGTEV